MILAMEPLGGRCSEEQTEVSSTALSSHTVDQQWCGQDEGDRCELIHASQVFLGQDTGSIVMEKGRISHNLRRTRNRLLAFIYSDMLGGKNLCY